MRSTAIAVTTLVFACWGAGPGNAQTRTTTTGTTAVIKGCVTPVQRDGSLETRSTGTTTTPEEAPRDANNGDIVGNVYTLTDATPTTSPATKTTTYALRGHESELLKHKGHRVEITGTVMAPIASGAKETKGAAEGISRVQVTSVKMIGTDCTPAKKIGD